MNSTPEVAVAYHSGRGHNAVLARAVARGAADAGAVSALVAVDAVTEEQWARLDAAHAIVFGAPTYMGGASAAFHAFAEATSARWARRSWRDKLAAGFTVSGSKSGDKLNTLQYLAVFAAQHAMHWVSPDLLPGWNVSTGSEHDLNRLGFHLGVGAQANADEGPEAVTKADAETAYLLGRRVTETARRMYG
ncbi:flavodoxin family protein [Streptomyces albireticuli]|uniref:flavodoxin family protein n=1 Tax=Streptomyces albireticuli TaxID=1940 RepID=UPI00367D6539